MAGRRATLDPGDFSRSDLDRFGFVGFRSVKDLRAQRPCAADLPADAAGVYLAYRESDRAVSFLRKSPAGQWRGDLSLPLFDLRARWIADSRVVYIGKADRPTPASTNSLRTRVSAYLRFGAGSNARHAGGYPTWQLRDSASLLIAWCVVARPGVALQLERDPAVPVRCPTEGPRSVGRLEPHDRHDNAEPLERAIRALRANWDTMGSSCRWRKAGQPACRLRFT